MEFMPKVVLTLPSNNPRRKGNCKQQANNSNLLLQLKRPMPIQLVLPKDVQQSLLFYTQNMHKRLPATLDMLSCAVSVESFSSYF